MTYLFTSESVSAGHPDKVADQISDAILDAYLAQDSNSKVACETLVTTNKVVIAWEVKSKGTVNAEQVARDVIRKIGYTKKEYWFDADSCDVEVFLHEQSPDINRRPRKCWRSMSMRSMNDVWLCFEWDRKLYAIILGFGSQDFIRIKWNSSRMKRYAIFTSRCKISSDCRIFRW